MLIANKDIVINLPQWLKSAYTPRFQHPHCLQTECFVLSDQAKKRLNAFAKSHCILSFHRSDCLTQDLEKPKPKFVREVLEKCMR